MLSRITMAAKLSTLSSFFGINSQGNSNPLKTLSLGFHSSIQLTLNPNCKFGFEGINNLDEGVTLFNQMLQMEPMPLISEFDKLFDVLVKMNHGSEVGVLLEKLNLFRFRDSRNRSRHRRKCGHWYGFEGVKSIGDAVELFDQMLRLEPMPQMYDFSQLLNIVVKMKQFRQAIFMFKRLSLLGFPIDDVLMTTVMNCYCKLRKVNLGFAILGSMIKRGYAPDIVSITCLIEGLFLEANVVNAIKLFKKVIRDKLCEVNEITISTVLHGLMKAGQLVNAVKLLEILEKKKVQLNVVVYTIVLDGLCKARMVVEAMDLLFKMSDRGILPNVVTYTSFIQGLCSNNKVDFARYVFNELPSMNIRPDKIAYTVMIQGLCQKGLFSDVKDMLEKMERIGRFPDDVTYNIMIQGCLRHLDRLCSIGLFKAIIRRDFQLDARTFLMLLRHMQGSYGGDDRINNLIGKLMSGDTRHQMQGSNEDFMINSLKQKLISSAPIYLQK